MERGAGEDERGETTPRVLTVHRNVAWTSPTMGVGPVEGALRNSRSAETAGAGFVECEDRMSGRRTELGEKGVICGNARKGPVILARWDTVWVTCPGTSSQYRPPRPGGGRRGLRVDR